MIYRSLQILILATLLASSAGAAGSAEPFPGTAPDRRLMKAQEKSDQLFKDGQYQRAMMIYRNDLAPVGDKYAQYMVGYMYLAGKGVDEDAIMASAWYQLAAEREHETFARARDLLMQALNDEQRNRSNQIYAELRAELGDIAIISKLVSADLAYLRRLARTDNDLNIAIDGNYIARNEDEIRLLAKQLDARMSYLMVLAESDNSISTEELAEVSQLNHDVEKLLGANKY